MKPIFTFLILLILFTLLLSPVRLAQTGYQNTTTGKNISLQNISANGWISSEFLNRHLRIDLSYSKTKKIGLKSNSLGFNHFSQSMVAQYPLSKDYKPWESEKHFWIGVSEIAILEFIPWALAKWVRTWDDPEDNWANVSSESWWRNISSGWEYDGDNFETNNFAHPYHGNLFFNAARTNGYNFWESTAWSLSGSAIWEYFGETFRPAFNDWVYTGVGGANLGEITYRLSSMVTDNTASGYKRFWSEFWGTLINPVRGFNRAISGEMGRNFPNPVWSRPKDFLIMFDAGTRSIDKDGDESYEDKEIEGLFTFGLMYGNRFNAKKPFEFFAFNFALASGLPHFTTLNSTGFLFGYNLEKNRHRFDINLDFNYNNLIKETTTDTDTIYNGFLFGATQIYPHLLSIFPIGKQTNVVTQIGINGILTGATPDDYYVDPEGRVYDFGPGVGTRITGSIQNGIWNYVSFLYYGAWIWTQSQPDNSKHHIHYIMLEAQYPLTSFFSIGIGAGIYWRNSYYEDYSGVINGNYYSREASVVNQSHPIGRLFFRTALID